MTTKKNTPVQTVLLRILEAAVFTALPVLFDQFTKQLAANHLPGHPVELIRGVFSLQYLENHGAAFGMLQGRRFFFILITIVFLVLAMAFYVRIPRTKHFLVLRILVIFACAGAIGNFIDRLTLHYVRDFFYFSLIDFPIFNVADIYVTVSVTIFAVLILFFYKDDELSFTKIKKDRAEDE